MSAGALVATGAILLYLFLHKAVHPGLATSAVAAVCAVWSVTAVHLSDVHREVHTDSSCVVTHIHHTPREGPSSTLALVFCLTALATVAGRPRVIASSARTLFWATFAGTLIWWCSLSPSHDRVWLSDVALVADVPVLADDGSFNVSNVRNFDYIDACSATPSGDCVVGLDSAVSVERWENRSYNVNDVVGVDFFFSYWGPTLIAHALVSFEFRDGRFLCVSIETRKELGESYSPLNGLFRRFELIYVVADEADVIRVRSNFRSELSDVGAPPARWK